MLAGHLLITFLGRELIIAGHDGVRNVRGPGHSERLGLYWRTKFTRPLHMPQLSHVLTAA
jgi:hypothetical protein